MKFTVETLKETLNRNKALSTVGVKISTTYYDSALRQDLPFCFIESILDRVDLDDDCIMRLNLDDSNSFEVREENINWSNGFTINMEVNACNPVDIFNNIMLKAQQTSLYLHAIRMKKQCSILDPEQKVVKVKIDCHKLDENRDKVSPDFELKVSMIIYDTFSINFN